ncbi:cell adhesion protein [Clostridium botulinum]|nr:cell adhesion protein [Clostridium botulinum]
MGKWSNDLTDNLKQENFTSSRYHTGRKQYIPYLSFDNHITCTSYDGFQIQYPNNTEWLKIDFINPVSPSKISIQGNDISYLPKKIKISMSNNGIDYIEIDVIDNIKNNNEINEYAYKNPTKKYRFLKIEFLELHSTDWLAINQIQSFDEELLYLIKQNNNCYSINNNYIDLGKIDNNEELYNLINNSGYDDLSIITKELNTKRIPTKLENDYYKSFDVNLNDVKASINLIEEDDKKYIEYGCNNYKISDKIKEINNAKFEVLMKE